MALDIQNTSKFSVRDLEPQQKQAAKPVSASSASPEVLLIRSDEKSGYLSAPVTQAPVVNESNISDAVKSMNDVVQNVRRELEFSIDDESGRTVVKVMDSETGEVIRQLPEEEALSVARRLKEFMETRESAMEADNKSQNSAQGFIMEIRV